MSECRRAVAIAMIAVAMALLPWRAALAGEPTTTVSTAQMAAKSGYQRQLVCNKTRSTGSLVPKKTCTTRAQIDAERKAGQRLLHNPRRTGSGAGGTIAIGAWPGVAALAEGVENPPASSQSKAAAAAAYQNQVICKTKTAMGSHIPQKTCKTRAQLDAERERAQRMLHDVQAPHPVSGGEAAGPNG